MSDADAFRRQADDLLRQATSVINMGERSRLISKAVSLHMRADEAEALSRADATVIPFATDPPEAEASPEDAAPFKPANLP